MEVADSETEGEIHEKTPHKTRLDQFDVVIDENQTDGKKCENKMTLPYLTKYEKTRILAIRTLQITQGSALYIKRDWEEFQDMTAHEIAEAELEERTLPFKVRRFFSDNSYEEWKLDELKEVNNNRA